MEKLSTGDKVICLKSYPDTESDIRKKWFRKYMRIGELYTVSDIYSGMGTEEIVTFKEIGNENIGFFRSLFSDKISLSNITLGAEEFVIVLTYKDRADELYMTNGKLVVFNDGEMADLASDVIEVGHDFIASSCKISELGNFTGNEIKKYFITNKVQYDDDNS